MSNWFKNNSWKEHFPSFFQEQDSYKDSDPENEGRGLLQRFIELFARYTDEELIPAIDNFVENLRDVDLVESDLLPYLEEELGVDLFITQDIPTRRRVLKLFMLIASLKGTKLGYTIAIKAMNFPNLIIYEVDVETYFDNPLPTAGCNRCVEYDVIVDASLRVIEPDVVDTLFAIARYNEPIDCKLRFFVYNDNNIIPNFVTFNYDYGDENNPAPYSIDGFLYMDNSRAPTATASIGSEAELLLTAPYESNYEIDSKYLANQGNVIHRFPNANTYTPFSLQNPTNIGKTSFTINWDSKAGAVRYFVVVGKRFSEDYQLIIEDRVVDYADVLLNTSFAVTGLEEDTPYHYQVFAENAEGKIAFTETRAVITLQTVSDVTALAGVGDTGFFTANWTPISEATGYDIEVATDAGFSNIVQTKGLDSNVGSTQITIAAGTYYYRVRGKIHLNQYLTPKVKSYSDNYSNTITVTVS